MPTAAPTPIAGSTELQLHSAGQRQINRVWEYTQATIALAITLVSLSVSAILAITGEADSQVAAFVFIYGVANLVIGFYFGRTNHSRVGGVAYDEDHR